VDKIEPFKQRMGWRIPWYSSFGSNFNADFGVTTGAGETFGLSVFLRHGRRVFQTYFVDRRGVEYLGSNWTYLCRDEMTVALQTACACIRGSWKVAL
jgi:predicted dithiol-disulfide oxidoreductase (DUF899 family)